MMIRKELLLALSLAAVVASGQTIPVEDFSRDVEFESAAISPGGSHIAVITRIDDKRALAFIDRARMERVWVAKMPDIREVGDFIWANNERVVFQVWHKHPASDTSTYYGELIAVNFDGKRGRTIFGYDAYEMQTGSHIKKNEPDLAWADFIDGLPDDDKNILIASTAWSQNLESRSDILKLNIYSGSLKKQARPPVLWPQVVTDHDGVPRFATGVDRKNRHQSFFRVDENARWEPFRPLGDVEVTPIAFGERESLVYLLASPEDDLTAVFLYDMATKEQHVVHEDSLVDPDELIFSSDGRMLYGLRYENDYPHYILLTSRHPEAELFKNLLAAMPGTRLSITSISTDGRFAIVRTESDRDPGTYYLLDKQKASVTRLFQERSWLKGEQLAIVEPRVFESSDGQEIHGYMTLPTGSSGQRMPLVVMPHGGPHEVRDYWEFNPETQFLASRGYAVLQVNFRGSGGYGRRFEQAGYREWGDRVQWDIIDATRALIADGTISPDRVCICGTSFGAYSALQSVVLAPELFTCAVGISGVYDLNLMFRIGDIEERDSGTAYLEEVIGTEAAELRAFSPATHADKITAKIMLVHGEDDERSPFKHATVMKDALDETGAEVEWLVFPKERHGIYSAENRAMVYQRVSDFLAENLGVVTEPVED